MIPSFHPNNQPNLLTTIEIRYATRCTFSRLLYHSLSSGSVITRFLEIQIYFHHRNITIASVPKLSILNLNEREPGNDFTCDCAHEFKTLRFSDSFTRPNRILLSLREETERRKKSFPGIDAIMVIMAAGYVHTSGLASVSSINFCPGDALSTASKCSHSGIRRSFIISPFITRDSTSRFLASFACPFETRVLFFFFFYENYD